MGSDVRFDEGAHRQFADPGGDIPAAVRHGLPLHPTPVRQAVVGIGMARRNDAGSSGDHGRLALFPDRKHGAGIRPGFERLADRVHGARMDGRTAEPALPRRTDDAAAGRGFGVGVRRHGTRRPQRPFRAPALAQGRHAGIVGGTAVDGLFAGHQTHRRPLPCRIHHPQGILLRAADHPPVFVFQPFSITSEVLARPAVWGNLLFLGLVASMLCYVLWNAAMHRLGAVRTTNYIYFNPLVTIITAAACIGERITPAALAGAALILYGMWRAERG